MKPLLTLGLMSGTSLDGVDAALLYTDGQQLVQPGAACTLPYPPAVRHQLRAVLAEPHNPDHQRAADALLVEWHDRAVRQLCQQAGVMLAEVDVIGFHGQTIDHCPAQRRTVQLGDGAALARRLRRPVVGQFRSADVAAGGQGAPLVPVYHQALVRQLGLTEPVVVANIGGVANITFITPTLLQAFDTGPGNALVDDWLLQHTGHAQDTDGAWAARGQVHPAALATLLEAPFFALPPPKSLDRLDFHQRWQTCTSAMRSTGLMAPPRSRPLPPIAWLQRNAGWSAPPPTGYCVAGGGITLASSMR